MCVCMYVCVCALCVIPYFMTNVDARRTHGCMRLVGYITNVHTCMYTFSRMTKMICSFLWSAHVCVKLVKDTFMNLDCIWEFLYRNTMTYILMYKYADVHTFIEIRWPTLLYVQMRWPTWAIWYRCISEAHTHTHTHNTWMYDLN